MSDLKESARNYANSSHISDDMINLLGLCQILELHRLEEKAFIAGAEYQKEKMLSEAILDFNEWFLNYPCWNLEMSRQESCRLAWQASRLSALKEIEELKKEIEILKELK